jgi:hypothetical protein
VYQSFKIVLKIYFQLASLLLSPLFIHAVFNFQFINHATTWIKSFCSSLHLIFFIYNFSHSSYSFHFIIFFFICLLLYLFSQCLFLYFDHSLFHSISSFLLTAKHSGQLKRIAITTINLLSFLLTLETREDDTENIFYERFIQLSVDELVKINFYRHIGITKENGKVRTTLFMRFFVLFRFFLLC